MQKKEAARFFPNLYVDKTAERIIDEIDYDFSSVEKTSTRLCTASGFSKLRCVKMILLTK